MHHRPHPWSQNMSAGMLASASVREYVFYVSDFKKNMTFYVFFEMTYQKVVKSLQQKFSPQCVKMSSYRPTSLSDHCNSIPSSRSVSHSEPSLKILVDRIDRSEQIIWSTYDFIHNRKRNRLTEARARDLVYVHSNLKLLQKLRSLDYQEANIEWERWVVSDSDSSEEEQ